MNFDKGVVSSHLPRPSVNVIDNVCYKYIQKLTKNDRMIEFQTCVYFLSTFCVVYAEPVCHSRIH